MIIGEGCASKKRRSDDVSKFKKFYHNLTSEFNGYFNANELYESSLTTLKEANLDNYTQILEVYDYVSIPDPKMVNNDLDKAIEKVTRVAAIHEPGDWVDDCYVLMGKSQYLKQDYETALETFEYFEEDFNPQNPYGRNYTKKKVDKKAIAKQRKKEREAIKKEKEKKREELKKEREEQKKRLKKEREDAKKARERLRKERKANNLKRKKEREKIEKEKAKKEATTTTTPTPTGANTKEDVEQAIKKEKKKEKVQKDKTAYYEGLVWLAKTYIKVEQYSSAEFLLKKIEDVPTLNKKVRRELPATFADLMIKQGDYALAVVYLEEAIEAEKSKATKARYHYIIGQILSQEGDSAGAAANFSKAKRFAKNYKMKFMSELSTIKNEIDQGARAKSNGIKKLEKMLTEEKNDGLHYLTHYTLGQIYLEQGDTEEGINSLRASNSVNSNDNPIKTEANYTLATHYLDNKDYLNAKLYYDSTSMVMIDTDKRYKKVNKLAKNLEGIAQNIQTIQRLDSLITMASMPMDELKKIAEAKVKENAKNDKLIDQKKGDKSKKKMKTRSVRKLSMNSKWFAYNPISVQNGIKEFKKVWGNRELKDNWRRSQEESLFDEDETEIDFQEKEEEEIVVSDIMIKELLPDVPWTVKRKEEYREKIRVAMFELGKQYKDKVDDNQQSYDTMDKLNAKYTNHVDEAEALYYQYVTALELGKDVTAIKKAILSKYPDSKYAKILNDPTFAEKFMTPEQKAEKYYEQSFELFSKEKYDRVIDRFATAEKQYKDSPIMSKFTLLNAMAVGNIEGKEAYATALQKVIARYPKTEEETKAKEILRFLKGDNTAFNQVNVKAVEEVFTMEPDRRHYCAVILFDYSDDALQQAKISISKYNKQYHSLDKLQMGELILSQTEKTQLILVRSFDGQADAMTYYEGVMKSRDEFIAPSIANFEIYAISQRNYRKLAQQRTHSNYEVYFEKNYLNK